MNENIVEEFLKDDEFTQYIINDYLADTNMSDEEKLEYISLSVEVFNDATECFKSGSKACKYVRYFNGQIFLCAR